MGRQVERFHASRYEELRQRHREKDGETETEWGGDREKGLMPADMRNSPLPILSCQVPLMNTAKPGDWGLQAV